LSKSASTQFINWYQVCKILLEQHPKVFTGHLADLIANHIHDIHLISLPTRWLDSTA